MRYQLYANNRNGSRGYGNGKDKNSGKRVYSGGMAIEYRKQEQVDLILRSRITAALEKYDGDAKTRAEIQDRLNMYCCNVTIARECNDKAAIRRLRTELITYLNKI